MLLPGRLGDPKMTLGTDPRTDRRVVKALSALGLSHDLPLSPVGPESSLAEIRAQIADTEAGLMALPDMLTTEALPPVAGVESSTKVITGVDGNDISLYIHRPSRPADTTESLPCVVHFHGGAMVMLTAADPGFVRWRDELAARDLVVVGVEFRNGAGVLGTHPFPAGLNDCASAVHWVHRNKVALGISTTIISGESGGGNLLRSRLL